MQIAVQEKVPPITVGNVCFHQKRWQSLYDDAGSEFLTMSSWRTKQILLPIRPVVTVDEKCLELVKRKVIIFHEDNARFSFWLGCEDFSGGEHKAKRFWARVVFTHLLCWILDLQNIISLKCQEQLIVEKEKNLRWWNYEVAWKMAEIVKRKVYKVIILHFSSSKVTLCCLYFKDLIVSFKLSFSFLLARTCNPNELNISSLVFSCDWVFQKFSLSHLYYQ